MLSKEMLEKMPSKNTFYERILRLGILDKNGNVNNDKIIELGNVSQDQLVWWKGETMKKQAVLLFLIFLFIGCAGPHINWVDPAGRVIPRPHYMLQSTSDLNIQTVSYWAKYKSKQDLDGSMILDPTFLPYTKDYKFSMKKYSHVTLTVEVLNPNRVKYKLVEKVTVIGKHLKINRRIIGISNLRYRQFTINLPFRKEDLGKIQYGVDLITIDDMPIMHFGNLNYILTN